MFINVLFLIFSTLLEITFALTASSDTLLWRQLNKTIQGISRVEEAFILVPADYEDAFSPLIPVNIRKFTRNKVKGVGGEAVNLWFIPGGPGQSSKTLEVMLKVLVIDLPAGSSIYAIDHRGLGKSTPLASEEEKGILEAFPNDLNLLPQIISNHQKKLGILTPITRVLRVENVARDFLKGVELVKKEPGEIRKHFIIGISYGTMVARRALQIAPVGTFEGVLLDGLAPNEKIEQSNESDRILQEICDQVEGCSELLRSIEGADAIKVRGIIPSILQNNSIQRNSCTNYFMATIKGDPANNTLCSNLHELMNAVLLGGRASVKVGGLKLMFEMIRCSDPEGFKRLFDAVYESMIIGASINQLQSAAIATSKERNQQVSKLTSDELVFEVVSALERYDVTRSTMNICFNKKHTVNGDDLQTCPSRLFDPCKFFRTTWERKRALKGVSGELPSISIKTPMVIAPRTRIIVLAGNLDFSTPTWLTRQITAKYTKGPEVSYHEFFGYGHGIYGSSKCNREIFAEFLQGGRENTANCTRKWNERNSKLIDGFFKDSLSQLSNIINARNY